MTWTRLVALLCSAPALVACGHVHNFNPTPNVGALRAHPLTGKRIALDLSRTITEYKGSAGGHSFRVTGIRTQAEFIARRFFSKDQVVASPQQADATLSLDLGFSMSSALLGAKCTCTAKWDIRSRAGSVVATGTATDDASFPAMKNGGRNCEIAHLKSMAAALDNTFAQLRANPAALSATSRAPARAPTPAPAPGPAPTPAPAPAAEAKVWFWGKGGQKNGPHTTAEMRGLYGNKRIAADTLVWRTGLSSWMMLCNAAGLDNLVQWYYGRGGSKVGPVTAPQIRQLVRSGSMPNTTLVWRQGQARWAPLRTLKEFADLAR